MIVVYWYPGVRSVLSLIPTISSVNPTCYGGPINLQHCSKLLMRTWNFLQHKQHFCHFCSLSQVWFQYLTHTLPVSGWTLYLGNLCDKPWAPMFKFTGHESGPCHVIIMLLLFLQDCTSHKNDLLARFPCQGNPEWFRGSRAGLSPSWRSGCSLSLGWTKMTVTRHLQCWSCFNVEWVQDRSRSPAPSLPWMSHHLNIERS